MVLREEECRVSGFFVFEMFRIVSGKRTEEWNGEFEIKLGLLSLFDLYFLSTSFGFMYFVIFRIGIQEQSLFHCSSI